MFGITTFFSACTQVNAKPNNNFTGTGYQLYRSINFRVLLPTWLFTFILTAITIALVTVGIKVNIYLFTKYQSFLTYSNLSKQQLPNSSSIITTTTITTTTIATATAIKNNCFCNSIANNKAAKKQTTKKKKEEEEITAAIIIEGCLLEARAADFWKKSWGLVDLDAFEYAQGDLTQWQPGTQAGLLLSLPSSWHNHYYCYNYNNSITKSKASFAQLAKAKKLCKTCFFENNSTNLQPLLERIGSYLSDTKASSIYRCMFPKEDVENLIISGKKRKQYIQQVCHHVWKIT